MDGLDCGGTRGLVAKAFVHKDHVVVDRLRHSHNCKRQVSALCLFRDCQSSALAPIAADHEENVYLEFDETVYHAHWVLGPSGCTDVGAAEAVNIRHRVRREIDDAMTVFGIESFVTVGNAQDSAHSVPVMRLQDDGSNHIVEPGANPTARDDGADGGCGVEEDFSSWPRDFEARQPASIIEEVQDSLARMIDEDPIIVVVERVCDSGFPEKWLQWRFNAPFAQRANDKFVLI